MLRGILVLGCVALVGCGEGGSGGGGAGGEPPSLEGVQVFPADNWWNLDISSYPVHPNSDAIVSNIGAGTSLHCDFSSTGGGNYGIPYTTVGEGQALVPVTFLWPAESDPGPYPIPPDAPIENGSDRHVIVVDTHASLLYDMYNSYFTNPGWDSSAGAVFDLTSNDLRPAGWTSADAAGLPIFPGLARYDEVVEEDEVRHAFRFTVSKTRKGYVTPARHYSSTVVSDVRPAMGMRLRLKAGFDVSGFCPEVQVILNALKTYGMLVADHGADWYISGAPHPGWDDDNLHEIHQVKGGSFEVVYTGEVIDGE